MTDRHDPELAAAMARAFAYTDDVGLSDGTDRPATDAAAVLEDVEDEKQEREQRIQAMLEAEGPFLSRGDR